MRSIKKITNFAVQNRNNTFNYYKMIIVPVKEGENIERALKKFKRKFEKPSVTKREEKMHAIYVQHLQQSEN